MRDAEKYVSRPEGSNFPQLLYTIVSFGEMITADNQNNFANRKAFRLRNSCFMETDMSIETSGSSKSDQKADLQEIVRAIDVAIELSRARNQRFLTYLLEMAKLEAATLTSSSTSTAKLYTLPDAPPKESK